MVYLTGFADEAAADVDGQIRATKELGWSNIESRAIDGKNIHDLDDAAFDQACRKFDAAGIRINAFGSAIANWGKQITDPMDVTWAEVGRAIPRMKRLGTRLIRIMSFAVLKDKGPNDQMEEERFLRLREIVKRFADEGMTAVHENCMNYGGMGWRYTLKLLENVPGLKLVFDTGNPVFAVDRSYPEPCPQQSVWEFYSRVRPHIAHVHIKDGYVTPEGKHIFTFAGEGQGDTRLVMRDLLESGYEGGISIEPHLAVVFHDASVQADSVVRYNNYVEYGRRFMALLRDVKPGIQFS